MDPGPRLLEEQGRRWVSFAAPKKNETRSKQGGPWTGPDDLLAVFSAQEPGDGGGLEWGWTMGGVG